MATTFTMTVSRKTGKGFLEISGGPLPGEALVVPPTSPAGDSPKAMLQWFGNFAAVGDLLVTGERTFQMMRPELGV